MSKKRVYRKTYSSFSGIDTSAPPSMIEDFRMANAENMYIDYEAGHGLMLETVPGFREIHNFNDKIYGIFHYRFSDTEDGGNEYLVIHAGSSLYRFPVGERDFIDTPEPIMVGLARKHSCAFAAGDSLYILDSEAYYRVDSDGYCKRLTDEDAYIPTTMYRGEECEGKNILTDKFRNAFVLTDATEMLGDESEFTFEVISEELLTCRVTGMLDKRQHVAIVPSTATINGKKYAVTRIGPNAFASTDISLVSLPSTLYEIEGHAFFGCKKLTCVSLPDNIWSIDTYAFSECSSLSEVYLGSGVSKIFLGAFYGIASDATLYYNGDEEKFKGISIDNTQNYFNYTPVYSTKQPQYRFFYHTVSRGCVSISSVNIDGNSVAANDMRPSVSYAIQKSAVDEVEGIYICIKSDVIIKSREIEVFAKFNPLLDSIADRKSFFSAHPEYTNGFFDAIAKCTAAEIHGESVFLTGNPLLPNTVFYSSKDLGGCMNPLYFGAHSFIEDGIGNTQNVAMISADETLVVIKSEANHGSSVYYHTKKSEGEDGEDVYSRGQSSASIGRVLAAANFLDDPVVFSDTGLFGIDIDNVNLERSINRRSSNIDSVMLKDTLSSARLAEWLGYLCVLIDGEIYLADSRGRFTHRSGSKEYEWFRLTEIGVFEGQHTVYFTLTEPKSEHTHITWNGIDCPIVYDGEEREVGSDGELISTYPLPADENPTAYPFLLTTGESGEPLAVACDTRGELSGGEFSPACELCAVGELLFFGCENGSICCFNNDKRDKTTDDISVFGRIPRKYYTHNGRRYRSGFSTASDSCKELGSAKSTVPKSTVIRLRAHSGSRLHVAILTDRNGRQRTEEINAGAFDFSDTDFSALSFATHENVSIVIPEKEKRWSEKQYEIYTNDFMRPFGVYDLSYDYTVAGRIKK